MNKFADFLTEKQMEICGVVDTPSDRYMANKCNIPAIQWLGFRRGELKPPEQYLLQCIANGLGMQFDDLRRIAESRIW